MSAIAKALWPYRHEAAALVMSLFLIVAWGLLAQLFGMDKNQLLLGSVTMIACYTYIKSGAWK